MKKRELKAQIDGLRDRLAYTERQLIALAKALGYERKTKPFITDMDDSFTLPNYQWVKTEAKSE